MAHSSPDTSTRILTRIGEATSKTVSASLAASWLSELENAIGETKAGIHARIQSDLPTFDAQLAASRSVQARLSTLTDGVSALSEDISHPELGLVPSLLRALAAHAALAQQARDASLLSDALSHLSHLRREFDRLDGLAREGQLAQAVEAARTLEGLVDASPPALAQSDALTAFRNDFRVVRDRVEEQLSDAYKRAVLLSQRRIAVEPSVAIRGSAAASISLSEIFASFAPASLERITSLLRRDIAAQVVGALLAQPATLSHASGSMLEITPAPPSAYANHAARLENLSTALDFISARLFPALPAAFAQSLAKPLTQALLKDFLQPLLPSSVGGLKSYERLTRAAVELENKFIVGVMGQDARDCEVRAWAERVPAHAEKRAVSEALENARRIALGPAGELEPFEIDVAVEAPMSPTPELPTQPFVPTPATTARKNDDWGFDDAGDNAEDGWGLDDAEEVAEPEPTPPPKPPTPPPSEPALQDDTDAWGWDDDEAEPTPQPDPEPAPAPEPTEDTWDVDEDDPWGESSAELSVPDQAPASAPALASPPKPAAQPKRATRLERLANKGKAKASSSSARGGTPPPPTPASPEFARPPKITVSTKPGPQPKPQPPSQLSRSNGVSHNNPPQPTTPRREKERFLTTARARALADTAAAALRASAEFARLGGGMGEQLQRAAGGVLDVFRVLAPVLSFSASSDSEGMLRANDCAYLAVWARGHGMDAPADALDALGAGWRDGAIDAQEARVLDALAGTDGFAEVGEADGFDACEVAVAGALGAVRDAARSWKDVLATRRHYAAVGALADAVLERVLGDILALDDITEDESQRLGELCRVLNALEGLFGDTDSPEQTSHVVAYVPSWLKFSYLSELLEASLADISYLFAEGALVDFERDELVRLVRALFAESPARETLVAKLQSAPASE